MLGFNRFQGNGSRLSFALLLTATQFGSLGTANARGMGQCIRASEYNIAGSSKSARKMNGSGMVNGRVVDKKGKSKECLGMDGDVSAKGAGGCLTAFFSVAADLSQYRVGDIIYLPDINEGNLKVPSGKRHPGFFIVQDTGGAIKGPSRFDFYTGTKSLADSRNIFGGAGQKFKILQDRKKCELPFYVIRRGGTANVPGKGSVSYQQALAAIQEAAGAGKGQPLQIAEADDSSAST